MNLEPGSYLARRFATFGACLVHIMKHPFTKWWDYHHSAACTNLMDSFMCYGICLLVCIYLAHTSCVRQLITKIICKCVMCLFTGLTRPCLLSYIDNLSSYLQILSTSIWHSLYKMMISSGLYFRHQSIGSGM